MNLQRHGWSLGAALLAFVILTLLGGGIGMPELYAFGALAVACTVLYLRYRRRQAQVVAVPVTPAKDDRVIPQDVKIMVAIRDGGKCQLGGPGCLIDRDLQYDHKYPWSKGGSSKDPDNIQLACSVCNRAKSDKVPV